MATPATFTTESQHGAFRAVFEVTAPDTVDVGDLTIPHGFACVGVDNAAKDAYAKANIAITVMPLTDGARLSNWVVTSVDRTNIVISSTLDQGFADPNPQLRVVAKLPVSMMKPLS